MNKCRAVAFICGLFMVVLPVVLLHTDIAGAQSKEELQSNIDNGYSRLAELEKEIAGYKEQLQKVGAEKSTLQSAINKLELERKKVQADIAYTQNKIGTTDLEISKLSLEIQDTTKSIDLDKQAIMETLRRINQSDSDPLIVSLLQYNKLSDFWNTITELEQVRDSLGSKVQELTAQNAILTDQKLTSTQKREQLVKLKDQYSDQTKILASNKAEKSQLLEETKNQEATYQAQLATKQAAYDQLQNQVRSYESQLKFLLDPSTIPAAGTAVFAWPLDNIIITQYFGGTEFASRNAGVYGGRPYHPGVDFGAPVGTPIHAPLSGTVRAIGNTDAVAGCYSWGKWTLIDHANGLSTLYAHQSVISVSPGQSVNTGDTIGYTGNTGYTTGPHLHFTVYAQKGVTIHKFSEIKAVTNCGAATTPVAATDAYLDPMNYLPPY